MGRQPVKSVEDKTRIVLVGWCGLVVCLAAGSLTAASPAAGVAGYGDVADDEYFTKPVQWSVDNDIAGIDGDCFLPDAPVSRGEAAVYIWNMEGQPSAPSHSFIDVTDESQNAAVSWMSHNQITTGTTPTTFEPDTTLTRAHLVTFLHRLIGEPEAPAHPFVDVHASWQQNSVSWASHTGITTGTSPTTFEPDNTLTRAHLVTFLWRYKGKPEVTVDPDTPRCDPSSTDETDTNETDTNETDTNETDTNETDTNETDTNETGHRRNRHQRNRHRRNRHRRSNGHQPSVHRGLRRLRPFVRNRHQQQNRMLGTQ